MALKLRRGSDAQRLEIIPEEGELIYTTDTKSLFVGDGTTIGGNGILPALSGDIDLNGNDIIGTGNINIDGTITATGNINLGDGAEDNISVGGVITTNLRPNAPDTLDIGSFSAPWRNIIGQSVFADVNGSVKSLDGSTIIVDSLTNTINTNFINLIDSMSIDTDTPYGWQINAKQTNNGDFSAKLTLDTTGYEDTDNGRNFIEFRQWRADSTEAKPIGDMGWQYRNEQTPGSQHKHVYRMRVLDENNSSFAATALLYQFDEGFVLTTNGTNVGGPEFRFTKTDFDLTNYTGDIGLTTTGAVTIAGSDVDVTGDVKLNNALGFTTGNSNEYEIRALATGNGGPISKLTIDVTGYEDTDNGRNLIEFRQWRADSSDAKPIGDMGWQYRNEQTGTGQHKHVYRMRVLDENNPSNANTALLYQFDEGFVLSTNGTNVGGPEFRFTKDDLNVRDYSGALNWETTSTARIAGSIITLDGTVVSTGEVTADAFKGSVVGDDSTVLVDAVNGTIPGYISISALKAIAAASGTYGDFQAAIAAL
jgi:hypothetical protein